MSRTESKVVILGDSHLKRRHNSHNRRKQLDTLLVLYNLNSTVNFPTRIFSCSSTPISNIFIDLLLNFTINPLISGMSDHNVQLLVLENVIAPIQESTSCYVGNIDSFTIDEFQSKLNTESWENIFEGSDTHVLFTTF
jgi:hypothetical protein